MNGLAGWGLVALGGALGAVARHGAGLTALRLAGPGWPSGTFAVNVLGGLAMGLLAGWLAHAVDGGRAARLFFGVGFLGGFTTFSAFSLETALMIERKAYAGAAAYAAGSAVASILALFAGLWIMRRAFA